MGRLRYEYAAVGGHNAQVGCIIGKTGMVGRITPLPSEEFGIAIYET